MTQFLHIHPENPQVRFINQVVEFIQRGGIVVYPTDSAYAIGCQVGDKSAQERIKLLRKLPPDHNFTLVCRDLSELATYAQVDNATFRLLKAYTPGPYTFILDATHEVPRRLQHPKRKTIGLRVPDNKISQAILEVLNQPLMSVTLLLPGEEVPTIDPEEMYQHLQGKVDAVIDGGFCGSEFSSIVDLTGPIPKVIRKGKGDISAFE